MNKFLIFFLTILFNLHFGYAQDIEKKAQLSLSTGWQQEDFHWSIAGNINGQNPNILSELKWKNVNGLNYAAALKWNVWKKISVYGDYNRQFIKSGSVNDMDYNGDNRTAPIYTGNFSDNKGYTSSFNAGAGYILFNNNLFSLIPYIGYGVSTQALYLVDLTGQFPTLNSTYQSNWKGPFIKVNSSIRLLQPLKLTAGIAYHQVNYSAQGDWNLINEFQHPVSYRHNADGYGLNANAMLVFSITHYIAVNISYGYFNWETGTGYDQLYLSTGQIDKTQMNGAAFKGFDIAGGIDISM
ncbi:MAG: hypothetical protein JWQ63_237 [Mucilaginibacter sp.]|nr:hypothetical protein [Mucilaginibacter sp.]